MLVQKIPPELRTAALGNHPIPTFLSVPWSTHLRAAGGEAGTLVKRLLLWSQLEMMRAQIEEVAGGMEREKREWAFTDRLDLGVN